MTSKPSEYTAFLPNTLLTLVNSKAFIPFILSSPSSDQVSLAALAASQHQRHADLLTLPASTTLAEVLAFFRQYDITAVPLVQDAAHSRHKAKAKHSPSSVVGVFSMHDLLRPLIHHPIFDQAPASLFPQPPSASSSSSLPRLSEAEFLSQLSALPVWSSPVLPFMSCNESNRSSWFLLAKQKVGDAAAALSSGLRHVLVLEGDDIHSSHPATVSMLSAGDLARFIYTSLPSDVSERSTLPAPLSALLCSPVSAHVHSRSIIAFQEQDCTLLAFRRLAAPAAGSRPSSSPSSEASPSPSASSSAVSALGAVPIVNAQHMVIDNLSATDLRLLTPATFHRILEPLASFLHTLRSTASSPAAPSSPSSFSSSPGKRNLRPPFAATVSGSLAMGMMLEKVVNLGISRVWVVDESAKPVGVIALSDLFRMIVALKLHE